MHLTGTLVAQFDNTIYRALGRAVQHSCHQVLTPLKKLVYCIFKVSFNITLISSNKVLFNEYSCLCYLFLSFQNSLINKSKMFLAKSQGMESYRFQSRYQYQLLKITNLNSFTKGYCFRKGNMSKVRQIRLLP